MSALSRTLHRRSVRDWVARARVRQGKFISKGDGGRPRCGPFLGEDPTTSRDTLSWPPDLTPYLPSLFGGWAGDVGVGLVVETKRQVVLGGMPRLIVPTGHHAASKTADGTLLEIAVDQPQCRPGTDAVLLSGGSRREATTVSRWRGQAPSFVPSSC